MAVVTQSQERDFTFARGGLVGLEQLSLSPFLPRTVLSAAPEIEKCTLLLLFLWLIVRASTPMPLLLLHCRQ